MMLIALEEDSRFPYVVDSSGAAVGVFTLQTRRRVPGRLGRRRLRLAAAGLPHRPHATRAGGLAPWPLRLPSVKRPNSPSRLGGGETGVVLSVNERNPAGQAAYRKAGFEDHGQYLGGDAGPQRTMYRAF